MLIYTHRSRDDSKTQATSSKSTTNATCRVTTRNGNASPILSALRSWRRVSALIIARLSALTDLLSVRIKDVKKQIQANYEETIRRCNRIKTDVDGAEESMRANVQKVASDWQVEHHSLCTSEA